MCAAISTSLTTRQKTDAITNPVSTAKSFATLPNAINLHILSYLKITEWETASKISSFFMRLTLEESLENACVEMTIYPPFEEIDPYSIRAKCSNWKETYLQIHYSLSERTVDASDLLQFEYPAPIRISHKHCIQHLDLTFSEKNVLTNTISTTKSLASLPDEINLNILSYLKIPEWETASKINSLYKRLSVDDFLWKPMAIDVIRVLKIDDPQLLRVFCSNWKETHKLSSNILISLITQEVSQLVNYFIVP